MQTAEDYREALKVLLGDANYIDRDRFSKEDFVTIICPEHGIYYKTVQDVLEDKWQCNVCSYLNPSTMMDELLEVTPAPEQEPDAIFYRIKVEHKRTGLIFQKIGTTTSSESFNTFWDQWKWKDFLITPISKIACSNNEADELQRTFQEQNQNQKIHIPNELKFNMNKTYELNEIWQAKSKTIPILREVMLQKQKGKCTICARPVKAPTLDHMHIKRVRGTGYIRAVCCSQCNTFIARSENNASRHGISNEELPEVLRNMALHLENQTRIIHPTEVPKRKKVGLREWNKIRKYYFKVFPKKKVLPKKPIYVTDTWLELKREVDEYILNIELEKIFNKRKKTKVIYERQRTA